MATLRSFVIRHVWKNFFRHGYRKYEFPHDQGQNLAGHADKDHPVDIPNGAPGPEEVARQKEHVELLEKHLKRYPLEDQQIFIMVAKGDTYKEVGDVLGIPLSTVAYRHSKVIEGVQKELKGA